MIVTIYGINGVGKDAIAKEFSKSKPNCIVVSQSRLLMYHLGLATDFTPEAELKPDAYERLEAIEEKTIHMLGNTLCRDTVLELSASGKTVLCLSHFVVAKFFFGKYIYNSSIPSDWVKEKSDGLVFIEANPKDILIWRKGDNRKRSCSLEEIVLQQKKEKYYWKNLINDTRISNIVIQNYTCQMQEAAGHLKNFIDGIE